MDISKLQIEGDRVLIEAIEQKKVRGVLKGKTSDDKPEQGTVLLKGDKCTSNVEIGNVVIFNKYLTTKLQLDGKTYYILRSEDISGYFRV